VPMGSLSVMARETTAVRELRDPQRGVPPSVHVAMADRHSETRGLRGNGSLSHTCFHEAVPFKHGTIQEGSARSKGALIASQISHGGEKGYWHVCWRMYHGGMHPQHSWHPKTHTRFPPHPLN
jgi:hypothetical protein